MQIPILKYFFSDGDTSNKNIKWEKLPIFAYLIWAISSIFLIAIIQNNNLSIPRFSIFIYFGIFTLLHCSIRIYIGIPLNKPEPSVNEVVRLWLMRIETVGNLSDEYKKHTQVKKIKRKIYLLRLCFLITGVTMFFLCFWPFLGGGHY